MQLFAIGTDLLVVIHLNNVCLQYVKQRRLQHKMKSKDQAKFLKRISFNGNTNASQSLAVEGTIQPSAISDLRQICQKSTVNATMKTTMKT